MTDRAPKWRCRAVIEKKAAFHRGRKGIGIRFADRSFCFIPCHQPMAVRTPSTASPCSTPFRPLRGDFRLRATMWRLHRDGEHRSALRAGFEARLRRASNRELRFSGQRGDSGGVERPVLSAGQSLFRGRWLGEKHLEKCTLLVYGFYMRRRFRPHE